MKYFLKYEILYMFRDIKEIFFYIDVYRYVWYNTCRITQTCNTIRIYTDLYVGNRCLGMLSTIQTIFAMGCSCKRAVTFARLWIHHEHRFYFFPFNLLDNLSTCKGCYMKSTHNTLQYRTMSIIFPRFLLLFFISLPSPLINNRRTCWIFPSDSFVVASNSEYNIYVHIKYIKCMYRFILLSPKLCFCMYNILPIYIL